MKWVSVMALAIAALVSVGLASLSCSPVGQSGLAASLAIGTTTSEVNSLILIAQEQGYFSRNGLDVVRKIYPSGLAALDRMLVGEVDMATNSEFAFVGKVLAGENVRAVGVISKSSGEYLVARVDRGINTVADLKGKRIGVPLKSRPEFALDRFLLLRGIDGAAVTLVNVPVDQSVDALVGGKVDAVTAWQPYVSRIRERMGNGLVAWSTQENQPSYTLVMTTARLTAGSPGLAARFLKSLLQAEGYNARYPGPAKALVQKRLGYNDDYMENVWPDYFFSVSLDWPLVTAMEDEARWMIGNNLTSQKQVPDLLDYVYEDALKALKPGAVNIMR